MSMIPPQVNSSLPGVPAGSNGNNTGTPVPNGKSIYTYKYDFPNMFIEQSGKNDINAGKVLRYTLTCNGFSFNAHIDPSHLTDTKGKRLVQLDVLTGIVLQDFGYTPEIIEMQGTTGARYYKELVKLDTVFSNQSTNGLVPTPATLTIEGRTYTGVFRDFVWNRQIYDGNTYKYTILFVVMNQGAISNPNNTNSQVISANTVAVASTNSNGQNQVQYLTTYAGQTPSNYIQANSGTIGSSQRSAAMAYLASNWSTAPQNKRSFPGPNGRILSSEVLVVPASWQSVLSASTSNNAGGSTLISGNVSLGTIA